MTGQRDTIQSHRKTPGESVNGRFIGRAINETMKQYQESLQRSQDTPKQLIH